MFIIAGLGNPGRPYDGTRHNTGFCTIDKLTYDYGISVNKLKFRSLYGEGTINGVKVILIKPQTFMNLSGEAIRDFVHFYKINPAESLIVIYDDTSLPVSHIRIRKKGSDGGHNGIKNTIYHLNTDEFLRIKIGIGEKPVFMSLSDYVLSKFSKKETEEVIKGITDATEAVSFILAGDMSKAMNTFNKKNNLG